ncbi:MAG: cold shock domain-containing protein [Pseudomonadota bacterium]
MSEYVSAEETRHGLEAVVKWYNPTKGFGFVQLSDGSPDAFLHASVLERGGHAAPDPGATLVCDVAPGRRGLQVTEIASIAAAPPGSGESRPFSRPDSYNEPITQTVEGTVKFFNNEKGFGFIQPDDGGRDIFVSGRVLTQLGISYLEPEQRVRVGIRMGQKGPLAATVEML